MLEKEGKVKEERLFEATRKGLTGLEGKFGTILVHLGFPIITSGAGSYFHSNEMPDFYTNIEDDDINGLPTYEEDQLITESGYVFDGLSRGIHIEIQYLAYEQKLSVYYQGYLVYREVSGDLECYTPDTEWESKVDFLYNLAKLRENKKRLEDKKENQYEAKKQKLFFLQNLRKKWGI